MTDYQKTIQRYIQAKIAWTLCKQKHFKQLCHQCREYVGCPVYSEYCDAWIELCRVGRQASE